MKKTILIGFIILLTNLTFSQVSSDSTIELSKAKEELYKKINDKTIEHIKNIFAKSKTKRPTIGLALAGGGAKGFAHAGMLQLIDSLNIPVDYIAGNSMGGLVAALYSIGYSGKDLEKYGVELDWASMLNDSPERDELPFIEKKKDGMYQLSVGLKGYQPTAPSGVIYGHNAQMEFLRMTAPFEDVHDFNLLPIPFRCVAVDLVTGKEVILKKGSLAKAMRATMSIPSAFSPVDWDNYLLVDGLVLNNFPVDIVKDMGPDIVIGLNLTTGRMEKEDLEDIFSILNRTTDIPMSSRLYENIKLSDIYISQDLNGFSTSDFNSEKIGQIIERGKEAGKRYLDVFVELKKELEKFDEYKKWEKSGREKEHSAIIKKRESFVMDPPVIENITLTGNKKFDSKFILNYLRIEEGEVFTTKEVQRKINELYSLNYFESIYYEIEKTDGNNINLHVKVKEKMVNKIVAGFKYNDHFKLIGMFGIETNSALIHGAQMEAYFRFGGLTLFDVSVIYPSRSMDIPVYPFVKISYKEIPLNFYYNGSKIFSFRNRSWDFSGGLNFSLSKFWNLEASTNYELMNVATDVASSEIVETIDSLNPNAKIVAGKLHLLYDSLDDIILPNSGLFFKANIEVSLQEFGSALTYRRFYGIAKYFIPIGKKHNIKLSASYAWAGNGTPFYKWFFLGGPNTFVGIDYFQANGAEFTVGQVNYRYQFLKDLYINGTYNVMFGYNMGNPTEPIRGKPILGGGVSIIMRTMFGRTELMWSRGDANMYDPGKKVSRVYFTFGYNLR